MGSYADVYEYGMAVIDVADPAHPTQVGSLEVALEYSEPEELALSGNYAYIAAEDWPYVVNIGKPVNPVRVCYMGFPDVVMDLAVERNDRSTNP